MKNPKKFSKLSARHSSTPVCVAVESHHYFSTVREAKKLLRLTTGKLFVLDRKNGRWIEQKN